MPAINGLGRFIGQEGLRLRYEQLRHNCVLLKRLKLAKYTNMLWIIVLNTQYRGYLG